MDTLRNMGLRRRMFLSYTIMTLVTVAVSVTSIVSMLVLERMRNEMLVSGATNNEIIAASQQHILFTSCAVLAILVIGVVIALVLARRISLSVRIPIQRILDVIGQVGESGDMGFSEEVRQGIRDDSKYPDEIGRLSRDFLNMMDGILAKARVLEVAATGDLTRRAPSASENDTLANATNALIGNLNVMVGEVRAAADQLSVGISQISQGAQSFSQSTMEQTVTMESLLGTLGEISTQSKDNAMRSKEAADITSAIWSSAEEGRGSMDKMTQAMREINEASRSINVVMKAIDDIAFQTNILSLNAAVEAARAGQHGRGFAVVADEVRNLATKSASAAKDTNELIADTMKKSDMGSDIVKDTSEYLNKIMNGVSENTWILKNIAMATAEQNESIDAIKGGFGQLSGVVHHNSATAEESAAATQEMSSQTDLLIELVRRFKVGESGGYGDMQSFRSSGGAQVKGPDDEGAFISDFVESAAPVEPPAHADFAAPVEPAAPTYHASPAEPAAYGTEQWKDDESKY
ncbi:MAG: methyl-accepting chemotaxis protein [Clostridiales Family XIII bacterium]|nr:methyl-accepting chemotaxis protein [Clostridiales Family XIII bacterium]